MINVVCLRDNHPDYPNDIFHVEIVLDNGDMVSWKNAYPYKPDHGFYEAFGDAKITVFKLPISSEWVRKERIKIGSTRYARAKDRVVEPVDFPIEVYWKRRFSCSHIVACLLNMHEWWYKKPTDVYNELLKYGMPEIYEVTLTEDFRL